MALFGFLDYNEFDLTRQGLPYRWAFRHVECELASEFLSLDLKGMLAGQGFGGFVSYPFLWAMCGCWERKGWRKDMSADTDRIKELGKQIEDLKRRWPVHSVPPSMFQQLEELEEELRKARGEG